LDNQNTPKFIAPGSDIVILRTTLCGSVHGALTMIEMALLVFVLGVSVGVYLTRRSSRTRKALSQHNEQSLTPFQHRLQRAGLQTIRPAPTPWTPPPSYRPTEEFLDVKNDVLAGQTPLFVTGSAGTGKSTLVHWLASEGLGRLAIVAPTGVAALNAGGRTIHSFFGFPPRPVNMQDVRAIADPRMFKILQLLIIDEVSMVRADLMDGIDRFLRLNGPDENQPFGGVKVLLVGDPFQLSPVVAGHDEAQFIQAHYSSSFFFDAKSITDLPLFQIELTHVFRQKDEDYLRLLADLRVGHQLDTVVDRFNELVSPGEQVAKDTIVLTTRNNQAAQINQGRLDDLPGQERLFTGSITGEFRIKDDRLPSPRELRLKPGARVMFTKNDAQHRWVNGTMGTVTTVRADNVAVRLDGFTEPCDVTHETWEQIDYRFNATTRAIESQVVGSYRQLPVKLAWAVTIHKAQGLTLEAAHVDLGAGAFGRGQVYVALSRCRSMTKLTLERPLQRRDIRIEPAVTEFFARGGRNDTALNCAV